jgi:hypothetical protein
MKRGSLDTTTKRGKGKEREGGRGDLTEFRRERMQRCGGRLKKEEVSKTLTMLR